MRTVESVAGDDNVSARARARSADLQNGCPVPPLTTTDLVYYPSFFKPASRILAWKWNCPTGGGGRIPLTSVDFYFKKTRSDLKHDYIQEDAP